jgi:hypothetical protein
MEHVDIARAADRNGRAASQLDLRGQLHESRDGLELNGLIGGRLPKQEREAD